MNEPDFKLGADQKVAVVPRARDNFSFLLTTRGESVFENMQQYIWLI